MTGRAVGAACAAGAPSHGASAASRLALKSANSLTSISISPKIARASAPAGPLRAHSAASSARIAARAIALGSAGNVGFVVMPVHIVNF